MLFYSSTEKKLVTLSEYTDRMKEDQKSIYYASGESVNKIDLLPQTEYIKSKGYEILYLTDEVDEFVIQMAQDYKGKPFMSVFSEDMSQDETEADKEKIAKAEEENKELLSFIKESLEGKVAEVKLSPRLTGSAATITNKGEISLEMEKVLRAMPMAESNAFQAERILELNPDHEVLTIMKKAFSKDKNDQVARYANLLYNQALLISGLPIENPVEFAREINALITENK